MIYIAIDIEADQPSGNLIQIGAHYYDSINDTEYCFVEYVRNISGANPSWHQKLSNNLTLGELLGDEFRMEYEQSAVPPEEALARFWKWVAARGAPDEVVFLQWGRGDMDLIRKTSKISKIKYPEYLVVNLKQYYQSKIRPLLKTPKKAGLASVMNHLGITQIGRPHDALVDAIHTTLVFKEIQRRIADIETEEDLSLIKFANGNS